MTGSLRWRLMLIGAVSIVAALGAAALALSWLFADHVGRRAAMELRINLDQVIAALDFSGPRLAVRPPSSDPRYAQPFGGLYWQVETGDQVLRSRSLWDQALSQGAAAAPGGSGLIGFEGPNGAAAVGLEQTVRLPAGLGLPSARVIVAMDRASLSDAEDDFIRALAPYLIALALALIAAQAVQLAYGLRPLQRIGARVAALNAGEVTRMGAAWPSEVRPLAGEIDTLLAAREADIDRARTRAADLAHGLKTPLQALGGEAARLRHRGESEGADAIDTVAEAMRAHVERELARARRAPSSVRARAIVAATLAGLKTVVERTPDGERLAWRIDAPAGLAVAMEPSDLAEALGALVENAARHARASVALTAELVSGEVRIAVADDGPGVPDDRIDSLSRRGLRLDESRPGEGLGLAIAADIAQGAGGRLDLANTPHGFIAALHLPAAPERGG